MVSDEHRMACVIEAQANRINAYIKNITGLESALGEVTAIKKLTGY